MAHDHDEPDAAMTGPGRGAGGCNRSRPAAKTELWGLIEHHRRRAREHELRAAELQALHDALPERLGGAADAVLWDLLDAWRRQQP